MQLPILVKPPGNRPDSNKNETPSKQPMHFNQLYIKEGIFRKKLLVSKTQHAKQFSLYLIRHWLREQRKREMGVDQSGNPGNATGTPIHGPTLALLFATFKATHKIELHHKTLVTAAVISILNSSASIISIVKWSSPLPSHLRSYSKRCSRSAVVIALHRRRQTSSISAYNHLPHASDNFGVN